MKLFSYDNLFLSTLRRLVDYFVMGLLWMTASVPVKPCIMRFERVLNNVL